jgi:hypothetical protein
VPHGGAQIEETGGGDQGGEHPEGASEPEDGGERSGDQRADWHHREPDGPGRRGDPAQYVRRDVGLHKAVDDHVPDEDDASAVAHELGLPSVPKRKTGHVRLPLVARDAAPAVLATNDDIASALAAEDIERYSSS